MPPDTLIAIYQAQPAARKVFDWIRQADIEENRTTVEELIDNCGISRRHAVNLLRALADAGYGEFKVGRKGHPSRFEWSEAPQLLADWIEGHDGGSPDELDDELDELTPKPSDSLVAGNGELFVEMFPQTEHEPVATATSRAIELIEHSYVLRPKLRLVVKLPADLSAREAEVLGEWIKNLSFER
jgi:hypothetical protein